MTTHVYTRCMDGHYFEGRICPNDGSSSEESIAVADAVAGLGRPVTLDLLSEAGLSGDLLSRVLIVEERFDAWPPLLPIEIVEL